MDWREDMDRKSFFRGFGTGVLFTSAVLGISFTVRTSDPYVVSRAKEIGMVYGDSSSSGQLSLTGQAGEGAGSVQPSAVASTEPTQTPKATQVPKKTQLPKTTAGQTKASQKPAGQKPSQSPAATEGTGQKKDSEGNDSSKINKDISQQMEDEKKKIEKDIRNEQNTLKVEIGDWSSKVSKELQAMGIIKDAVDFDSYLVEHGYSKGIRSGTYEVSPGDTYEELARKITGK